MLYVESYWHLLLFIGLITEGELANSDLIKATSDMWCYQDVRYYSEIK